MILKSCDMGLLIFNSKKSRAQAGKIYVNEACLHASLSITKPKSFLHGITTHPLSASSHAPTLRREPCRRTTAPHPAGWFRNPLYHSTVTVLLPNSRTAQTFRGTCPDRTRVFASHTMQCGRLRSQVLPPTHTRSRILSNESNSTQLTNQINVRPPFSSRRIAVFSSAGSFGHRWHVRSFWKKQGIPDRRRLCG
jgi:hypothetical protein